MQKFLKTIIVLFLCMGVIKPVHAQKAMQDFKKPMPVFEMLSQEEFESQSVLYDDVPVGDEALAYEMRVPNTWEQFTDGGLSNYKISNKILGELARFYSPSRLMGTRSRITLQAIGLEYQMTAEQWLLQYLLSNGYTIEGFDTKSRDHVEAIYVFIEGSISYVVRAAAHVNGKRIVLVQHFLPVENWDEEKIMQAHTIESFVLKNPEKEFVEPMKTYHFLDVAELQYPETWDLRAPPLRSIDYMTAELLNVSSQQSNAKVTAKNKNITLDGKMDIKLVSVFVAETLEDEVAKFKEELSKTDLMLKEIIETPDDFVFSERFDFGTVEVHKAIDAGDSLLDYELWITILSAGDYYYFITLLTPSRDDDYFVWARNSETYRVVTSSIKPQEESLIED